MEETAGALEKQGCRFQPDGGASMGAPE